jgi:hypothetical protein
LSDVCAQQRCVAAPPLLDSEPNGVEDSGEDALAEVAIDSSAPADSPASALPDEGTGDVIAERQVDGAIDAAGVLADAPVEAAVDAAVEARSDAPVDAPPDAAPDTSVDAPLDSSVDGAEGG